MTNLFLLDRGAHSVSFAERPDPSLTVWLDFQMLDLPLLKFGTVSNIPADELSYHIRSDVNVAIRAIERANPRVLISSGRACLIHCELLAQKCWTGKNVFIDFPESGCHIPSRALKSNSIFLSSHEPIEKRLALKPPKSTAKPVADLTSTIAASQINDYVQEHFF